MKKRRSGFTLIELMIVVAIVSIVGFIVLGQVFWAPSQGQIESVAKHHAQQMGWNVEGLSCVKYDTDGDGYHSCTINTGVSERAILCAWSRTDWGNRGCKTAPLLRLDRNGAQTQE